jgi:hypothetical protein
MSALEAQLRLSVLQAELRRVAESLPPKRARIVRYAASVLELLREP